MGRCWPPPSVSPASAFRSRYSALNRYPRRVSRESASHPARAPHALDTSLACESALDAPPSPSPPPTPPSTIELAWLLAAAPTPDPHAPGVRLREVKLHPFGLAIVARDGIAENQLPVY